jgi:hypothetical protein
MLNVLLLLLLLTWLTAVVSSFSLGPSTHTCSSTRSTTAASTLAGLQNHCELIPFMSCYDALLMRGGSY